MGRNSAHWGAVFLSAISAGIVIVPVLPDFNIDNTNHIIDHSEAKIIFCAKSLLSKVKFDDASNLKTLVVLDDFTVHQSHDDGAEYKLADSFSYYQSNKLNPKSFVFEEWGREYTCIISYTSGTSGFSKGVMIPGTEPNSQYYLCKGKYATGTRKQDCFIFTHGPCIWTAV